MANPIGGALGLFFTVVAGIMILLVVLAGTATTYPLNTLYFFEAYTGAIPGAAVRTAWTLWNMCALDWWGNSYDCSPVQASYPLLPQKNFGVVQGVPWDFFFNGQRYLQLSQAVFAFFILSLVFIGISLIVGILAICFRVGAMIASCCAALAVVSVFFSAAVMTGHYVQARSAFTNSGLQASIGTKSFALTWAAVLCMLLAALSFCAGVAGGVRREKRVDRRTTVVEKYDNSRRRRTYR